MNKVKTLMIFTNGNVAAFDESGAQVPDIQADGWLDVYLTHLESKGIDPTKIKIEMFVNGRPVYAEPIKTEDGWWNCAFKNR